MNGNKIQLHWQILMALILAFIIGVSIQVGGLESSGFAEGLVSSCEFLGKLFMNALKMIMVPLIVSSIICGVMGLGAQSNFGRMGLKTFTYYAATGMLAIIVGLVLVNVIKPGVVDQETAMMITGQADTSEKLTSKFEDRGAKDLVDIFLRMVPPNIVDAATDNGQLLGLIVFSLIFGFFISQLKNNLYDFQVNFWQSILEIMMKITNLIIKFAPIGVFGLVTPIIVRTGLEIFQPLFWFVVTVVGALSIHFFITLSILLKTFGNINPLTHYKAMAPVLLTAFSSASSAATIPVTLKTVENSAGVSNRTASFTIPLGATVNMDGTALYECIVVIFIAQFYGVVEGFEIGFITQFKIVLLALLTSVGVAGIPAASFVAITVILGVVGLPIEAVGMVWVIDRVLDMCRTATNVFSDTCGAVIIAKSEGENVYGSNDEKPS